MYKSEAEGISIDTTSAGGFRRRYYAGEAALYGEDEISLGRRLKVNAGVRAVAYGIQGKTRARLEPRLALRYQFSDFGSIKASYSEMNQFVHQVQTFYADLPTTLWMPSTAKVGPMHSSQLAGGIYTDLPYNIHVDLEGWYKRMDHMLEYSGPTTLFPPVDGWENAYSEGRGESYGLESTVALHKEKFDASVGYTLSWSYRMFEDFSTLRYPDRNDNRHKLNITLTWRPGKKVELYAGWLYHSGSRITVPDYEVKRNFYREGNDEGIEYYGSYDTDEVYSRPYNFKLSDYHRLDLGANFHRTTKRGNEGIWNISIYNAYCRMNPFTGWLDDNYYDEARDKRYFGKAAIGIGLIPIIPTVSYTLKF